jgi:hypothetical protein
MSEELEKNDRGDVWSRSVRAGRRTYFFDVKSTRENDYYLTITESKKLFDNDGKLTFKKHKIFLYKEDFDKFIGGLNEAITHIRENAPAVQTNYTPEEKKNDDISFEDLGA